VRVVSAVIVARPEMMENLLRTCSPELVGRFREREENVRLDVLACFTTLLQASMSSAANRSTKRKSSIPSIVHTQAVEPGSLIPAPGKISYFVFVICYLLFVICYLLFFLILSHFSCIILFYLIFSYIFLLI
jgi:hypothetical protein